MADDASGSNSDQDDVPHDEGGSNSDQEEEEEDDDAPPSHATKREAFAAAAEAVQGGLSIRKAAKLHGVSSSWLSYQLRNGLSPGKPGRAPSISEEDERALVDWCLEMIKIGCPHFKMGLPHVVKALLKSKDLMLFPPDNIPTQGWVSKFLKRHTVFSNEILEHLPNIKTPVSYKNVMKFFSDMEVDFKARNVNVHSFFSDVNAKRIFSCGENGYLLNATDKSSKVLARKGAKMPSKQGEEGNHFVSVFLCVSGSGNLIKPLFINKGKCVTQYASHGMETSSYCATSSEISWMTGEIFYSWLTKVFHPELEKRNVEKPVILFLDSGCSHILLNTLTFTRENGIMLYFLPPKSSHVLQPLDVGLTESIKVNYKTSLRECLDTLPHEELPEVHFPYVFMTALERSKVKVNSINGFKAAGLVPFDPSAIKQENFFGEVGNPPGYLPNERQNEEESRARREQPTVGTTGLTASEIYRLGFEAGQDNSLHRFEALMPRDVLELYRSRFEAGESWQQYEEAYYRWQELKLKPPCSSNPFDENIMTVEVDVQPHFLCI